MKTLKKILSLLMAFAVICALPLSAFAAPFDDAVIDFTKSASVNIYKYDLTGAEKDGIWDSSYVSTGVRDESGVEAILGNPSRVSSLNANGTAYGYAVPRVEFTYLKIADIRTFSVSENDAEHVEVLYGIKPTENTNAFLTAIGLSTDDRYAPADMQEDGQTVYYYQSDKLITGLHNALSANSTVVKNKLEKYVKDNNGTAMAETDAYGHSVASNLPLGMYLFVETRVPEMVVDTTDPFLLSLPMTAVNGSNATNGGEAWNYDVTLYPKNNTGIPSLEKTLREAKADTGKHGGSTSDITDGYAHTASASTGDMIDYQIISTLPSITSAASYISEYTFVDTLAKGLSYKKNDVVLEFFKDKNCTDCITSWAENSGKFAISYNAGADGKNVMTISLTPAGLTELNTSTAVYSGASMVNSGFSDCTLRVSYQARINTDSTVVFGDAGNSNAVALQWKRTNSSFYDTLVDDCHVYVYGIDLTKRFSDGQGDMSKVEFVAYNSTDKYFLLAAPNAAEGVWYITGHTVDEANATHFVPNTQGKLVIKGTEDDNYIFAEVKTAPGYSLLKDKIQIAIVQSQSATVCDIYSTDALGLIQNDPRYANVSAGSYHNLPQKHLEHKALTAAAAVDGNRVNMSKDGNSENAFVPFNVVNTKGFDLPQTGSRGNWMFPVIGLSGLSAAILGIILLSRKKTAQD